MRLPPWVREHKVASSIVTVLGFLVVTFPIWLAQVWTLFSDRVFADVMRENNWGLLVVGPLYGWFAVALVAVGVAVMFMILGAALQRPASGQMSTPKERRETLALSIPNDRFDQDMLRLSVTNRGPTDSFAVQLGWGHGFTGVMFPCSLRWKDSNDEAKQIVSGHTHFVDVLRAPHVKNPETGEFSLDQFVLFTPASEVAVGPSWFVPQLVTDTIGLYLEITSTTTGIATRCEIFVDVTVTGKAAPRSLGTSVGGPVKRQAVLAYQGPLR